ALGAAHGLAFFLARQRYADDVGVERHGGANEALDVEHRLATVELEDLGNQHEPVTRAHRGTEADVFHAAEANAVAVTETLSHRVIGTKLGSRLAHQHAGQ